MKRYTIYVDDELNDFLESLAEIENMSVPKLIVELALRRMLKDKIKKELSK